VEAARKPVERTGHSILAGTKEPTDSSHKQYNARVDFNATKKDLIAFSMYYVPNTSVAQNGNGDRAANSFNFKSENRAATVLCGVSHVCPTLFNEARVNASGWEERTFRLANNPQAPLGLPQIGITQPGDTGLNTFGVLATAITSTSGTYAGKMF